MTFYQVVTLASIVEHEAAVDEERALIAGVYQNRLDGLRGVPRILNADPTVTFATDTMALAKLPFEQWQEYFFWKVPAGPLADVRSTSALQGYQTYQVAGLIPGPISTPSLASIDAALAAGPGQGLPLLRGHPGHQDARVREDARGAQREPAQVRLPVTVDDEPVAWPARPADWPHPADFAAPPTAADRRALGRRGPGGAARARRPAARADGAEGVDGYFGVRWEHMRYLTGLPFDESEVTGSGDSGKFLVGLDDVWVVADSRYTIAVQARCPGHDACSRRHSAHRPLGRARSRRPA